MHISYFNKSKLFISNIFKEEFDIMVIFPKYSPFYEFFYKMIGIKKFIYLNQSLSNKEISNVDKIWGMLKSKKNIFKLLLRIHK